MTQYRKKSRIVDAARIHSIDGETVTFTGGDTWLEEALDKGVGEDGGVWVLNEGIRIGTMEGTMRASEGDYIVRGIRGELYCIKGDIFPELYEPLDTND